jgi:hypothetical protein
MTASWQDTHPVFILSTKNAPWQLPSARLSRRAQGHNLRRQFVRIMPNHMQSYLHTLTLWALITTSRLRVWLFREIGTVYSQIAGRQIIDHRMRAMLSIVSHQVSRDDSRIEHHPIDLPPEVAVQ